MAEVTGIDAKFTADISDMKSKLSTIVGQLGQTQGSFLGMASSVFTGQTAFNLLSTGLEAVGGFLEDSVKASLNVAGAMAIVETNVKNAGFSYAELKGQLSTYADAQEKLGFTNLETEQSVSKLLLATKDYSKALNINQLAMDLARSRNEDLSTATSQLVLLMAGNNRILKQYNIEVDKGTTAAEKFALLQAKVGGSAQAAAETSAGSIKALNVQWDEMKIKVGDKLAPVVNNFMSGIVAVMPTVTKLVSGLVDLFGKAAEGIGEFFSNFSKDMDTISKGLGNKGSFVDAFKTDISNIQKGFAPVPGSKSKATGGSITEDGLYMLHAGENVVPSHQVAAGGAGQGVSVNFYGGMTLNKEADETRLASKIQDVIMRSFELGARGVY